MMRFIVTLSLLFSMLGSIACGLQYDHEVGDTQRIESVDGPKISASDHNCPQKGSDSHHNDNPCGDHCHHHGHCHYGFLVNNTKMSCPSSEASQGTNFDSFHPDPHINNLFRPPIV